MRFQAMLRAYLRYSSVVIFVSW